MVKRTESQKEAEKRYKATHPAITLRMDQASHDDVKRSAEELNTTHHGLINSIIKQWLEANKMKTIQSTNINFLNFQIGVTKNDDGSCSFHGDNIDQVFNLGDYNKAYLVSFKDSPNEFYIYAPQAKGKERYSGYNPETGGVNELDNHGWLKACDNIDTDLPKDEIKASMVFEYVTVENQLDALQDYLDATFELFSHKEVINIMSSLGYRFSQ